jgi:hypothetical protein
VLEPWRCSCACPLFPPSHVRHMAGPGADITIGSYWSRSTSRGVGSVGRCQSAKLAVNVMDTDAFSACEQHASAMTLRVHSNPGVPLAMGTWMVAAPKAAREIERSETKLLWTLGPQKSHRVNHITRCGQCSPRSSRAIKDPFLFMSVSGSVKSLQLAVLGRLLSRGSSRAPSTSPQHLRREASHRHHGRQRELSVAHSRRHRRPPSKAARQQQRPLRRRQWIQPVAAGPHSPGHGGRVRSM